MIENVMLETYNKISIFIKHIIDEILSDNIQLQEVPCASLQDIIIQNFKSYSQYLNPTVSFHTSISYTFAMLNNAIFDGSTTLCIDLLKLLDLQIKTFVIMETSWSSTMDYNSKITDTVIYSMEQWEEHTITKLDRINLFSGKGCVYTAVTGGYDNLHAPEYVDPTLNYICFTDNPKLSSDVWEIRYIDNSDTLDSIRLARKHKILCNDYLPEYDYSIWIDGKVIITGNIIDVIQKYHLSSPMLCMPHYERNCIYDEADKCISAGKGNPDFIKQQIQKYHNEGYPSHNGLIDSCVLFRVHHDPLLNTMLNIWWDEVLNESTRDQLSFPYACFKSGFTYDLCNFSIYNNPYFKIVNHNTQ